jgi:hypothetical protein
VGVLVGVGVGLVVGVGVGVSVGARVGLDTGGGVGVPVDVGTGLSVGSPVLAAKGRSAVGVSIPGSGDALRGEAQAVIVTSKIRRANVHRLMRSPSTQVLLKSDSSGRFAAHSAFI